MDTPCASEIAGINKRKVRKYNKVLMLTTIWLQYKFTLKPFRVFKRLSNVLIKLSTKASGVSYERSGSFLPDLYKFPDEDGIPGGNHQGVDTVGKMADINLFNESPLVNRKVFAVNGQVAG